MMKTEAGIDVRWREKIVAKLFVFFVLVLYRRLVSPFLPFFLPRRAL
jgi:hypothetical protein